MKKVDVIINTYMLSKLQSVLVRYKLPGATVSNVQGMGIQAGQGSSYYSGRIWNRICVPKHGWNLLWKINTWRK